MGFHAECELLKHIKKSGGVLLGRLKNSLTLMVFLFFLHFLDGHNKFKFMCKPLSVHITGKFNFMPIDWYMTENVLHRWKDGHVKKLVRRGFGKTKLDLKVWLLDSPIKEEMPRVLDITFFC